MLSLLCRLSFYFGADIDECINDTLNNCQHSCVNQVPSFSCECRTGFTLQDDGVNCSGVNIFWVLQCTVGRKFVLLYVRCQ